MPDKPTNGAELPGAFSEKELRWSYWWVTHRERVRKAGIGLFIAVDAALVLYGAWGFIDWLAIGGLREEQMIRALASPGYAAFGGVGSPREITVNTPIVLQALQGRYDVLVPVENPNPDYWTELTYRLVVGGEPTALKTAFILPGQSKYLAELGLEAGAGGSAEVQVERRLWHRVRLPPGSPPYGEWSAERLDIATEDATYVPPDPQAPAPAGRAAFDLVNRTAYGYYDVDVLALLLRGETIVAANRVALDRLEAGERRHMELYWQQALPQVTRIEVFPDVNVLDPDVYRAP